MHKRSREWPQLSYKYRIYPTSLAGQRIKEFHDLPPSMQEEAKNMRALWNAYVELFDRQRERYQEILAQEDQVSTLKVAVEEVRSRAEVCKKNLNQARARLKSKSHPDLAPYDLALKEAKVALVRVKDNLKAAKGLAKATYEPELAALREQFFLDAKQAALSSPCHWGNVEFIGATFDAALKRFFKHGGGVPREQAGPFRSVCFRQRFTGGGLPSPRIYQGKRIVWLEHEPPREAYAKRTPGSLKKKLTRLKGGFRVGNEMLDFTIALSRPLPPGSFIKTATVVGEPAQRQYLRNDSFYAGAWRWHIVFTVEIPPESITILTKGNRPSAAIDLNWRVWDDRIRFGFLVDTEGTRRELFLPRHIVSDWRKVQEHQEKTDALTNDAKEQIAQSQFFVDQEWKSLPEDCHGLFTSLTLVKTSGLWRLLRLEQNGLIPGHLLRTWANLWSDHDRQRRGIHGRIIRSRNDFYRNLSLELCKRYEEISIEDLDLKQLAEKETRVVAIERSQQYRQLVGLSYLVSFIKQASKKTTTTIKKKDPTMTTAECNLCGAITLNNGKVTLFCPNGHSFDQDENAAINILEASA